MLRMMIRFMLLLRMRGLIMYDIVAFIIVSLPLTILLVTTSDGELV